MAAKISLHEDGIRVNFQYDQQLLLLVKAIPGRHPVYDADKHFQYWLIPVQPEATDQLKNFADKAGTVVPANVLDALTNAETRKMAAWALSAAKTSTARIPFPAEIADRIKPFQRAGVEYMQTQGGRVLVGDDMGLGKTMQAISFLEVSGDFPCLVVCPASLKYNWRNEFDRWAPAHHGHITILNGKSSEVGGAHVVIVNYENLGKHQWLWRMPWKALVVDESHLIKNPKAQRTNFVLDLAKDIPHVLLLSGTPVLNRPIELVPQLQALGKLNTFGGFWGFARRYCNATRGQFGWMFDGAENLDELNRKLRETCYIRREKKEVLPELPDKTRTVLPVAIDNRPEYNRAEEELIEYIKEQGRVDKKFLKELDEEMNRLAEAGDEIGMSGELADKYRADRIAEYRMSKAERAARAQELVMIETLKQITARGKFKMAADWITTFLEDHPAHKLIVFATHKDVIDGIEAMLTKAGVTPLILTGDTKAEDRQRFVDLFQKDPSFRVFVSNIQAGGVGITLTAASYVLFLEYGWNPGVMDQAEDRAYRIGQKNAVSVYWMSGEDTIDEASIAIIEGKRKVVSAVTDGGDNDIEQVRDYLLKRS